MYIPSTGTWTDQIIPYLAIAGGSVRVSEITGHARTNVEIIKKFGFELRIDDVSYTDGL